MSDPRVIPANQGLSLEDGPDRGRIIVDGASTGGAYALMEWTVAANPDSGSQPSYGPHRHDGCEETFLIQTGCLQFLLDDSIITLSHGDFVRVPSGVRHRYCNVTNEPVRLLVGFQPRGSKPCL